ncbi:MAG: preprotein translocase subunit SecG [Muribaculaceae bacterium]|nr:preprotein translocase subunit SecG [Bacteroides sp.]MDE7496474.1 preprotein translocase subunit SecG [Muribaculaceae bacterium]
MYIFLSILIVIACLLLVGAVLIQKSKGGGLASDYSGGNQYLGYRKTTDFIEKATWSLAIFICVLSILAAFTVKAPMNVSSIAPAAAPATTAAPAPAAKPEAAPAPAAKPAATPAAAPAPKPAE